MSSLVKRSINKALNDSQLTSAVLKSCLKTVEKRGKTISELDDLEESRRKARAVRERSIDELDALHSTFKSAFTEAGGILHYADTAVAASRIVTKILSEKGLRTGVKSKSMVAEEIGLNKALIDAGIDAVESDLGEYIVQLAGETPSHITAPALHRSKESIGRLFAEKLGIEYTDDPHELTMVARRILRKRFIEAEFGISGANFVIAETGHVIVVENESNARLGASLPNVFIAVTGIEKVLPKLTDAAPILDLLPRSATGQRASAYVNFLLPNKSKSSDSQEFHLVLVDNGRSHALKDPLMREMLLCIRCGACLNICPVYRSVGGHAYCSVYPGPMGAVLSNLVGERTMMHQELPFLSTLCGVCKEICPIGIDIPRMLLELRSRADKPAIEKMAAIVWEWTMSSHTRLEMASQGAKLFSGLLPVSGVLENKSSFRKEVSK
jgi:L-lactate dehydrogenase complex protein LldF